MGASGPDTAPAAAPAASGMAMLGALCKICSVTYAGAFLSASIKPLSEYVFSNSSKEMPGV